MPNFQIGDRVSVIDQDITGVVVETWNDMVVITDDDSEFEWPDNRLEYKFSEIEENENA